MRQGRSYHDPVSSRDESETRRSNFGRTGMLASDREVSVADHLRLRQPRQSQRSMDERGCWRRQSRKGVVASEGTSVTIIPVAERANYSGRTRRR